MSTVSILGQELADYTSHFVLTQNKMHSSNNKKVHADLRVKMKTYSFFKTVTSIGLHCGFEFSITA